MHQNLAGRPEGYPETVTNEPLHSTRPLRFSCFQRRFRGVAADELASVARPQFQREHPDGAQSSRNLDRDPERPVARQDAELERSDADRLGRHDLRDFG